LGVIAGTIQLCPVYQTTARRGKEDPRDRPVRGHPANSLPLDDVEWSYQLFRNPESPDVEVGIFAMRKELIGRHIKFFTDFDMNVQVVQMNPLAVYNAVFYDQRLKGTTMVIDLGAETPT